MSRPHPPRREDLALLGFTHIAQSCQQEGAEEYQNVAAALTLGLLLGKEAPDVADWLLWGEEGENDREAISKALPMDSHTHNTEVAAHLTALYRQLVAHDAFWQGLADDAR